MNIELSKAVIRVTLSSRVTSCMHCELKDETMYHIEDQFFGQLIYPFAPKGFRVSQTASGDTNFISEWFEECVRIVRDDL